MLLSLSTEHRPATDLGFLLHKHPDRFQTFALSFGSAHVFYPCAGETACTACLLLDVDPVGLIRGKRGSVGGLHDQYVNDRPYVASSLLSVAIARVYGSALQGRCSGRQELAERAIPLSARLDVLPVRGGEDLLHDVFAPLGYDVEARRHPLDERFPEWGRSPYFSVTLTKQTTLAELLTHLYVLVPVFDHYKHYYVGADEVDKLLEKGGAWLAAHPRRDAIVRRYLHRQPSLTRAALARLRSDEEPGALADAAEADQVAGRQALEAAEAQSLNEQRLGAVLAALRAAGARRVLDLGCGEGKLLGELMADRRFEEIVGVDVSTRALEIAERRLRLDRLPASQAGRARLLQGSLTYRDRRLSGFDAAAVVEVIEHFDPPRLAAFARVLFQGTRPPTVILTSPNREYNVVWPSLPPGSLRHGDHRFEWTREEFQTWCRGAAERFGYGVRFLGVGPEAPGLGSPTQMAVFTMTVESGGGGDSPPESEPAQ